MHGRALQPLFGVCGGVGRLSVSFRLELAVQSFSELSEHLSGGPQLTILFDERSYFVLQARCRLVLHLAQPPVRDRLLQQPRCPPAATGPE